MKRNKRLLIFIILILMGFNTACQNNNHIIEEENVSLAVEGGKDYDTLMRSENVSNIVVDLYGIADASSIIFNDIVVIAVEMEIDNSFTDDVKEMIIDTVLASDKAIRQVLITDDKKVFEQIEKILNGLMNGRPYDDYVKEINRLIEKLKIMAIKKTQYAILIIIDKIRKVT